MNARNIFLIFVLLGSAILFFIFSQPSPESKVSESAKVQTMPTSSRLPSLPPLAPKTEALQTLPPSPPDDAVAFEADKNLAIYFDDMILGEIKEPEGVHLGWTNLSKPAIWDLPIPYAIAKSLPQPARVEEAIRYFNEKTPVKFVPIRGELHDGIIFIEAPEHCRSYLGKRGGLQPVYLSVDCSSNEILHELMHALGFVHEQSRIDRDAYVEILWDNIDPKHSSQFKKAPDVLMTLMNGTDFDFTSIMLYRPNVFSKQPGLTTLKSKTNDDIRPSQNALSPIDMERLERLYGHGR